MAQPDQIIMIPNFFFCNCEMIIVGEGDDVAQSLSLDILAGSYDDNATTPTTVAKSQIMNQCFLVVDRESG